MRRSRVPHSLLGKPLPPRLRGWRLCLRTGRQALREVDTFLDSHAAVLGVRLARSSATVSGGGPTISDVAAEREVLVRACIEACDAAPRSAAASILLRALTETGVHEVDPAGKAFMADRHRAVATQPTDNSRQAGLIAQTLRVGYEDRGQVLRLPEVSVYDHSTS